MIIKENNSDSAIAREIMTPHVIMVDIKALLNEVVALINEKDISAVFICDKEKGKYYIVSQADIVRFLYEKGLNQSNLADVPIANVMRGPIETCDVDETVDNIIRFMTERKYKRVLIESEGKPAGVISTRDIMMWNNTYFRKAKPQILLFMDNYNSTIISRHVFRENLNDKVDRDLIDIYGGALTTISMITNEVIKRSGKMRNIQKDKRSILLETYKGITGILICDYNSIELRKKLRDATRQFYQEHKRVIDSSHNNNQAIFSTLKIDIVVPIFDQNNKNEKKELHS